MKNNYKDYDKLTLYVKKNKLKEIIEHYSILGWELVEESENKRYEDIVDLTFIRPHHIKNKDELQLQQVYMEETLNALGRLEKHKHGKTTSLGLCLGLLAVSFIVLGVLIAFKLNDIWALAGGIAVVVVGIVLIIIECVMLPKVYKNEIIIYHQKHDELEAQIVMISKTVSDLTGGDYAQD